jgi:TolA-binding protein
VPALPTVLPRSEAPLLAVPSKLEPPQATHPSRSEAHATPVASTTSLAPAAAATAPAASAPALVAVVPPVASLRREMQLVDAARAELRHGAALTALDMLERYRSEFPRGELAPEASLLELSALLRAGRREQARTLGERLVAAEPTSQRAEAVRALLAGAQKP